MMWNFFKRHTIHWKRSWKFETSLISGLTTNLKKIEIAGKETLKEV